MLNLWKRVRAAGRFLRSRVFAVSMLSLVLALAVFQITTMTNTVYVNDQDGRSVHFIMENKPQRMLQNISGTFSEQETQPDTGNYTQVDTTNVYQVSLTVDGATTEHQVERGMTVSELLHENDVSYDGNDLLAPSAAKPLQPGDEVTLQRVEYEQYTEQEAIPFATVRKNSSLLKEGKSKCIQEGVDGVMEMTYMERTVDGEEEDVQLLGKKVVQKAVTETILIGGPKAISPMDFDLEVDENGKPLQYSRLLTEQVATGYSARDGALTASGRYAIPGHVAVNPNEIPYGTKLYITSRDNKFVYGCAIAADTGTGLLADIVDVDLFYDTYQESVLNGRRIVDIYVLE